MIAMNSLPDQAQSGSSSSQLPQNPPQAPATPAGYTGIGSKELEVATSAQVSEVPHLTEIGRDIDLPKEVISVGVKVNPNQIPVPPHLSAQGVAPAGDNVTVSSGATITLPLTDDQIAQGLKQDVTSSVRWLAEWCVRKLKQILALRRNAGRVN